MRSWDDSDPFNPNQPVHTPVHTSSARDLRSWDQFVVGELNDLRILAVLNVLLVALLIVAVALGLF